MFGFLGVFFGFLGLGMVLGLLYVLIRFGIPFIFWTIRLFSDIPGIWKTAWLEGVAEASAKAVVSKPQPPHQSD